MIVVPVILNDDSLRAVLSHCSVACLLLGQKLNNILGNGAKKLKVCTGEARHGCTKILSLSSSLSETSIVSFKWLPCEACQ